MAARIPIQIAATERVRDAIAERVVPGDGIGTTARWIIEQYLAIIELCELGVKTPEQIRDMIVHDDDVRRGRIKE